MVKKEKKISNKVIVKLERYIKASNKNYELIIKGKQ